MDYGVSEGASREYKQDRLQPDMKEVLSGIGGEVRPPPESLHVRPPRATQSVWVESDGPSTCRNGCLWRQHRRKEGRARKAEKKGKVLSFFPRRPA